MKIGIVTFHFSNNFGAALQAYALRKWLVGRGHDADFINYCPAHVEHGGDIKIGFDKKTIISNIKVLYLKQAHWRTRVLGDKNQQALFEKFKTEELGVTGQKFTKLEELDSIADSYGLLICGSDQIWSPSVQRGLDPAYFLGFGRTPRKISYAASFGSADYESLISCRADELLRGLDGIAVREESGLDLVKRISGVDATQVVDPTALISSYRHLIEKAADVTDSAHVFCYALRTDSGIRELSDCVATCLSKEVIAPRNPHSRWRPIGKVRNPGPNEWLALISRSSFVVTNSFHGTMFSILLKKPFLVAAIPGKKKGLNDRMISLLKCVGLDERLVSHFDAGTIRDLVEKPIDWDNVFQRLDQQVGLSQDYLTEQIGLAQSESRV